MDKKPQMVNGLMLIVGLQLILICSMGTKIRVTNQDNMKQVIVRVNDRGPYSHADIDLSYAAFAHIASPRKGNAVICYRILG